MPFTLDNFPMSEAEKRNRQSDFTGGKTPTETPAFLTERGGESATKARPPEYKAPLATDRLQGMTTPEPETPEIAEPAPAAELPQEAAPEGYVPAFMRTSGYQRERAVAATDITTDIVHQIQDDGIMNQVSDWINDLALADKREIDNIQINKALPKILEDRGLSASQGELILAQAKNALHAETIADRILRQVQRAPGREAMSLGAAGVSGVVGFFADPMNLVPGALVLKGAGMAGKLLPKVAQTLSKSKAAQFASFAAAEEAIRTTPRLVADPTYNYEKYLLNVGMGAAMGVGVAKGLPAAKWLASKSFGTLNKGSQVMLDAARESLNVRTAANMVSDAVRGSKNAAKNGNIRKAYKDLDTAQVAREARNKARADVAQSKSETILRRTVQGLHHVFNKPDVDLADPELLKSLNKSLTTILKQVDKEGQVADVVAKFEASVKQAQAKAGELANQTTKKPAAKGKLDKGSVETTRTTKPEPSFPEAMKAIETVRTQALDAIGDRTGVIAAKARTAIEANTISALRGLEAAAARQGIKVVRRTVKREAIYAEITNRVSKMLPSKAINEFTSLVGKYAPDVHLGTTLNRAFNSVGVKFNPAEDMRPQILDWILKDKKLVTQRAVKVREAVTTQFNRMRDDLEDAYQGQPNDKNFIRAKQILRDQQDEAEYIFDWAGMAHDKQASDLVKLDPRWALLSAQFEESLGKEGAKKLDELYNSAAQRAISNQFGTLTESLAAKLVRTQVPLARHMAMNILELPGGTGGAIRREQTAAILAEMNYTKIVYPAELAWRKLMDDASRDMGLGWFARAKMQNFNPNTPGVQQDIARAVMLETNARAMGKATTSPKYIKDFADELDRINNNLYDLQLQHGIEGITGANQMKHYMRQSWNDGAILDMINNTSIGRSGTLELFSKSLLQRANGRLSKTEANDLAETLLDLKLEAMNKPQVDAFTLRTENLNGSMASIEEVIKRMEKNGKDDSIENILKWVRTNVGGSPGYVHKRHFNLDYSTTIVKNGQEVSILDMLDNDVIGQVVRYGKEASGRSAISESTGGKLNSDQSVDDYILAMAQQAHEMGTHVNTKDVRNVFRQIMGLPYDGQLPMDWRKIRDAVSLAGMSGLGESQLAEFGLAANRGLSGLFGMNQLASKTVGRVKKWRKMELTEAQKNNIAFLSELQEYSRLYEDMHIMARQNVHFDARESQKTTNIISKVVETATGGKYRPLLQYLQTRYTGYGAVRTMEEQLAMSSLMQDAMKNVRTGKSFTSQARFDDIGLDLKLLKRKLDDGTITLREDGNIETLNMHSWSKADQQSVGVALQRHAGQQVQKGFAGEASPLMTNPKVAMMMQFKSYPLLAAEKQMARNVMFHDKEAGMGIALNAASSAAARTVRYYSLALALPHEKREAYLKNKFENDFAHDTVAYMGIVGSMVNNHDMARDLVFGNETSVADQLPVLNWGDNYLNAVKSANPLDQDGITERDLGNLQRGAAIGTIMWVNGFTGLMRNLMDTDQDDKYQGDTALQRD